MRAPAITTSLALLLLAACAETAGGEAPAPAASEAEAAPVTNTENGDTAMSFFELETRTLDGQPQPLSDFEGKVVLVVNTASECGLTPQYAGLQELHETYADRGLVVVGFPCNQFMGQEPGTPEQIASFCEKNYGVTFPMMEKVNVKDDPAPIYALLAERTGQVPDWNFAKYLVSRDGSQVTFFGAKTDPTGDELKSAIESAL